MLCNSWKRLIGGSALMGWEAVVDHRLQAEANNTYTLTLTASFCVPSTWLNRHCPSSLDEAKTLFTVYMLSPIAFKRGLNSSHHALEGINVD